MVLLRFEFNHGNSSIRAIPVQSIEAIFFEPVGCLAEFPSRQFLQIAVQLFGRKRKASQSGSRSYWHLLNLLQAAGKSWSESERQFVESLELEAAREAGTFEDVVPAIGELKSMGVRLFITSSLSAAAITLFLEQFCLTGFFSTVWDRDNSGGVKAAPLAAAIASASLRPENALYLTDTLEGMMVSKSLGVHSILMMNDPDEARRLAMHKPTGGVVSLQELPDLIRLVAAENAVRAGI
jgi:beta-phosphoglucomutase-like phosphatase (HAD superfamily)